MTRRANTAAVKIAVVLDSAWPATARWLFAGLAFIAAAALTSTARAAATYDGAWKVTIITQSGNCDPAYSYAVKVVGGRITYAGEGSFEISGRVSDGGSVNVAIVRGDQKASGSGKLSGNTGSGKWTGKSASTACSGRWEAARGF